MLKARVAGELLASGCAPQSMLLHQVYQVFFFFRAKKCIVFVENRQSVGYLHLGGRGGASQQVNHSVCQSVSDGILLAAKDNVRFDSAKKKKVAES
jgi:hypothetical protein